MIISGEKRKSEKKRLRHVEWTTSYDSRETSDESAKATINARELFALSVDADERRFGARRRASLARVTRRLRVRACARHRLASVALTVAVGVVVEAACPNEKARLAPSVAEGEKRRHSRGVRKRDEAAAAISRRRLL